MARLLHSIGFMIRETGQALDRVGCLLLDNPSYRETFWRHKPLLNLINVVPKLGSNSFVAESAAVVGDVQLGDNASVWYGAVVRGDMASVTIGQGSNVQDNAVVTTATDEAWTKPSPVSIGKNVTVGHNAHIKCATVGDNSLIGIAAVLEPGVTVGQGAIVAAGSVVTAGTAVPSGELWGGNPARKLRDVASGKDSNLAGFAAAYVPLAAQHKTAGGKDVFARLQERIAALPAPTTKA